MKDPDSYLVAVSPLVDPWAASMNAPECRNQNFDMAEPS